MALIKFVRLVQVMTKILELNFYSLWMFGINFGLPTSVRQGRHFPGSKAHISFLQENWLQIIQRASMIMANQFPCYNLYLLLWIDWRRYLKTREDVICYFVIALWRHLLSAINYEWSSKPTRNMILQHLLKIRTCDNCSDWQWQIR